MREPVVSPRLVVIDLRDLAWIDSFGVHAIVNSSTRIRHAGHRMVLLRGPPNVDRMFTVTGRSDEVEFCAFDPGKAPDDVLWELAQRADEDWSP